MRAAAFRKRLKQIKEKEGRTEDLRNEVLMLWAGKTNNIMAGAE